MTVYTVSDVAKMAGVSVRTLPDRTPCSAVRPAWANRSAALYVVYF